MNTSETIWREHHPRLRAFVKRRIPDEGAVDDVLQDMYLKVHTGLHSLKDEAKLLPWLFRIARNAVTDHYRSRKPTEDVPEWIPQPEPDQGEQALEGLSRCIQPMMQMLPENYREAVILSDLKGLPQMEVARAQGISLSGAKSRVQRGRALLRDMLIRHCLPGFDHGGRLSDYEPRCKENDAC